MKQAVLSAKPDGIVEMYSEEVAFIFDQHKILTIEVSAFLCRIQSVYYNIWYIMYVASLMSWINAIGGI